MANFGIGFGPRIRKSPYFEATVAAGVSHFTVYNHMLMPVSYGDPDDEYRRLVGAVCVWDVAGQRQIELSGPDADSLAQAVVSRDLASTDVGQARYAPMVDHSGRLLNDPLLLKVDRDVWWLSLADSDMLYWCRAVAAERRLAVEVTEAEVAPLAVQGPRAEDTVADLLGDWVRALGFFRFRVASLDGIPMLVGRSGWSRQGGFELYLQEPHRASDLWHQVMAAGAPHGIGPGAPNPAERIESGLLSFRCDTLDDTDPFEAGIGRFVDLDTDAEFIGKPALVAARQRGPSRTLVSLLIDGARLDGSQEPWPIRRDDEEVGSVRAAAYSLRLERNVARAMLPVALGEVGTTGLTVVTPVGERSATVVSTPIT